MRYVSLSTMPFLIATKLYLLEILTLDFRAQPVSAWLLWDKNYSAPMLEILEVLL